MEEREKQPTSPTINQQQLITKRKVLICCSMNWTQEKIVLGFYWTKLAKVMDDVKLVYIVKDQKHGERMHEKVVNEMDEFLKRCQENTIQCESVFHVGKPGEGICELVEKYKSHLVVMGSRGLNKFQRTVQTSVSEYVIHHCVAPVLVVPTSKDPIKWSTPTWMDANLTSDFERFKMQDSVSEPSE